MQLALIREGSDIFFISLEISKRACVPETTLMKFIDRGIIII